MVTKRIGEARVLLEAREPDADSGEGDSPETIALKLAQLKLAMKEKLEILKQLDNEIIEMLDTEIEIATEIEQCDDFNKKIHEALLKLDRHLSRPLGGGDLEGGTPGGGTGHPTPPHTKSKTRLPKLTLNPFDGDITRWKTFWDCYSSAIHNDPNLTDIDKFIYLQSLVTKTAKEAINGLALTADNYTQAIAILEKRFGDKQLIINKHMELLLGIETITSSNQLAGLRRMYDRVESNIRSLEALGVPPESYGSLLSSIFLKKLPSDVRLLVSRQLSGDWSLKEIMQGVEEELNARERMTTPTVKDVSRRTVHDLPTASALLSSNVSETNVCCYCQHQHSPETCGNVTAIIDRKQTLKASGRCYVCLRKGHLSRNCRSKGRCKRCSSKHHTSICDKGKAGSPTFKPPSHTAPSDSPSAMNPAASPFTSSSTTSCCAGSKAKNVLLQTAKAVVFNPRRPQYRTTASIVFDSGSQRSYVSEELSQLLQLKSLGSKHLTILTFGRRAQEPVKCERMEIGINERISGSTQTIGVFSVPLICEPTRQPPLKTSLNHLKELPLADTELNSGQSFKPDLLIGLKHYWSFVSGEIIRTPCNRPIAMNSSLGWVVSGPTPALSCEEESACLVTHVLKVSVSAEENDRRLEKQLQEFWDLESLGIKDKEGSVFEQFADVVEFKRGRYEVSLPWKDPAVSMPDNYKLCIKRLHANLQRLRQNPQLLQQYHEVMKEQLRQGIIEPVSIEGSDTDNFHYIPHHAVIKRHNLTTKIRIVYDASARCSGPSLNVCLHVGPKFNQRILEILRRFRLSPVIVAADIEKAFLIVGIKERDRDVLRFLWIKDPNQRPPEVCAYRFTRVMFGVACSPFLLNATLDHHFEQYRTVFPELVDQLKRSVYVDDVLLGADTEDQALQQCHRARALLQEGGFNLRKFLTNKCTLQPKLSSLEQTSETSTDSHTTYTQTVLGGSSGVPGQRKVPGVMWDTTQDELVFDPREVHALAKQITPSKRTVVSTIGKFYDPLGILSPILTPFKTFLQRLCVAKVGWDEILIGALLKEWEDLLESDQIVRVPRCYHPLGTNPIRRLCGFCDASTKAYAAVVYLITHTNEGTSAQLVCSKTRVAPIKDTTVPRLELLSAVLLSRLIDTTVHSLSAETTLLPPLCYTDSKVSYHWIRGWDKSWKPFVQNRVNEIRRLVPLSQWSHCPGNDNPADLPSRGMKMGELVQSSRWFQGPEWLQLDLHEIPDSSDLEIPVECEAEQRATTLIHLSGGADQCGSELGNLIPARNYSSLQRLLRTTAYLLLFICKTRTLDKSFVQLIKEAETRWIREAQKSTNLDMMKHLNPFLDLQGLWRCRGRIQHANIPYDTKHPILLPREHPLTKLIILHSHERVYHNGLKETLTEIRSQYWIPKGRSLVQKILHHCVVCRRLEAPSFRSPQPPPLPPFRVTEAPAFTYTGVDFAGPLLVKQVESSLEDRKVWLCLFTCCVTRGIHLELVPNMTTEAFFRCFRRFVARRGLPVRMISDNGRTFQAAARVFQKGEVQERLTTFKVEWLFNIERAPWWGGDIQKND